MADEAVEVLRPGKSLLINETKMCQLPKSSRRHISRKLFVLLPLRAVIYFSSLHYETPCISVK